MKMNNPKLNQHDHQDHHYQDHHHHHHHSYQRVIYVWRCPHVSRPLVPHPTSGGDRSVRKRLGQEDRHLGRRSRMNHDERGECFGE